MVDFRPLQHPQPEIGLPAKPVYQGVALQRLNGRQEAAPLQAVFIKVVRVNVGGGHQGQAAAEQRLHQFAKNHRIADVGHEELIETQNPSALGKAVGYPLQWIGRPAMRLQFAMHPLHEAMKVHPQLAAVRIVRWQRFVEQIHQQGLATPNAAPKI